MFSLVVGLIESLERGLQERKVVVQNIQESDTVFVVAVVQEKEEEGRSYQHQTW